MPAVELDAAHPPEVSPISYAPERAAEAGQICFTAETASAIAEDQEKFDMRVEALQEQEIMLQARRQDLDQKAGELLALQDTLEERWQQMSASADSDIEHLADMYSAMKPDQASAIFNQMDPSFAAGFLRLMPSDQAGLILAGMDTGKAYIISVKLASMNGDIRSASAP